MVLRTLHEFFAFSEDGIYQTRELMCGRGNGLTSAQACSHAPIVGAQSALAAVQAVCGKLQSLCDTVGNALGVPRDALAAGNASAGTQTQPRGEVLGRLEFRQIGTELCQDLQRVLTSMPPMRVKSTPAQPYSALRASKRGAFLVRPLFLFGVNSPVWRCMRESSASILTSASSMSI